jgi:tetratricopeptide (TPR) repeat protein
MLRRRSRTFGTAAVAVTVLACGVLYHYDRQGGVEAQNRAAQKVPTCDVCHAEIARTYGSVGMARSFQPLGQVDLELPPANIEHRRSGRYYEVVCRDRVLVQRRYEKTADGAATNVFELTATHVIGSGNHARTYFHLTAANELIELPLTWYAQENRWYLSPGMDRTAPRDFTRRADDSCLFCHKAYPRDGVAGRGIDCERCHSDGARHAALAARGVQAEQVRAAIVNPARLTPALQLDVCMQCHLETTSVDLPQMLRRFDRDVFSFRSGERLGDYVVHLDSASDRDRFEIVNQAYRLRQSACFRKSAGRMTCTTCQNPHVAVRGEAAVAKIRDSCRECHPVVKVQGHPNVAASDCAGCHMPKRRAEDAVHVVMTDHRITRFRPHGNLVAPHDEAPREFTGSLSVYYPELPASDRDQYLGAALITGGSDRRAGIAMLARAIDAQSSGRVFAVLAEGRLAEGDTAGAVRDFEAALQRGARTARVHYNLAQALDSAGQSEAATREFEEALRLDPSFPEAHYAFGNHLLKSGNSAAAAEQYAAAIRARPVYAEAHNNLGNVLASRKDNDGARREFEQALAIDPGLAEAHENEARVLAQAGKTNDALQHARRAVELKAGSPTAHYNLGQLLQATGALGPAIAEYRLALQQRPEFAAAHLALGGALGDSGNIEAAVAEFRAALALEPSNPEARRYLDMALAMRRR